MQYESQRVDEDLIALMNESAAPFNKRIVEGYAYGEQDKFVPHIDGVLRLFEKTLRGAGINISYDGVRTITPYERLAEEAKPRASKRTYDVARSDYHTKCFMFRFNGEQMRRRYLSFPFLRRGGTHKLRDSLYSVSPSLSDHLFSIEDSAVFMPVSRARFTFNREGFYYVADGKTESVDYYWARLHHSTKNEAPKARHPQIVNYILAEKGITRTFREYFNADVEFGTDEEINDINYPESDWVICRSAERKPRGRITGSNNIPALRIAVKREDYDNRSLKSALASVFYIMEICGHQEFFTIEDFDDAFLWKRALSRFIWKAVDERDAIQQVNEHLESIHEYVDDAVRRKLSKQGIEIENINELFHYIILNFSNMSINNDVASTHNKRLSVVEPLMFQARSMIFNLMFSLLRVPPKNLTLQTLERHIDRCWKAQILMKIGSGADHPEVQVLESTTDQMIWKVGGQVHVPSRNSSKSKSAEMNDPAFSLHEDMTTTCSWNAITKSSPSGRGRLNPFTMTDEDGNFIIDERFEAHRQNLRDLS